MDVRRVYGCGCLGMMWRSDDDFSKFVPREVGTGSSTVLVFFFFHSMAKFLLREIIGIVLVTSFMMSLSGYWKMIWVLFVCGEAIVRLLD